MVIRQIPNFLKFHGSHPEKKVHASSRGLQQYIFLRRIENNKDKMNFFKKCSKTIS